MNDIPELFIDKDCSVCRSFGDKVLNHTDSIYVKSIEELSHDLQALDSVILKTKNKTYIGIDAIEKVVVSWGGYYKYMNLTKLFPKNVNRFLYRLISINRHRLSIVFNVIKK